MGIWWMGEGKKNKSAHAWNDIIKQSDFLYVTRNAQLDRISANKHVVDQIDFGVNLSAILRRKYNNACESSTAYTSPADGRVPTDCDGNDCGWIPSILYCYSKTLYIVVRGTPTKSSTRLQRVHARCENTLTTKLNCVHHTYGIVLPEEGGGWNKTKHDSA